MPKLRDHTGIVARGEAFRVDPRVLKIDPGFNVRDLDAPTARDSLDELKASIRAEGVQVALEIRMVGDDLFVTSGHRRHKVVMELISEGVEIASIPAIAEPKAVDEADRVARLVTLNAGLPLSPLEKAEVVRRLMGFGWDRAKIAQRLGFKTEASVANYELLLAAPVEVKQAVRSGELSASNAVTMVRKDGDGAAKTLATARKTAAAKGKTKLTKATTNGAVTPAPEKPRNQLNVDKGTTLLYEVVHNGYSPASAANLFMAMSADKLAEILDWLTEFEDRVRQRELDKLPQHKDAA